MTKHDPSFLKFLAQLPKDGAAAEVAPSPESREQLYAIFNDRVTEKWKTMTYVVSEEIWDEHVRRVNIQMVQTRDPDKLRELASSIIRRELNGKPKLAYPLAIAAFNSLLSADDSQLHPRCQAITAAQETMKKIYWRRAERHRFKDNSEDDDIKISHGVGIHLSQEPDALDDSVGNLSKLLHNPEEKLNLAASPMDARLIAEQTAAIVARYAIRSKLSGWELP